MIFSQGIWRTYIILIHLVWISFSMIPCSLVGLACLDTCQHRRLNDLPRRVYTCRISDIDCAAPQVQLGNQITMKRTCTMVHIDHIYACTVNVIYCHTWDSFCICHHPARLHQNPSQLEQPNFWGSKMAITCTSMAGERATTRSWRFQIHKKTCLFRSLRQCGDITVHWFSWHLWWASRNGGRDVRVSECQSLFGKGLVFKISWHYSLS